MDGSAVTCGAVLVVYGQRAEDAARTALDALTRTNPRLPVTVHRERLGQWDDVQQSRCAKTLLFDWSPYQHTVYLDADTVVYADLQLGFDMLRDGWDMVIVPSQQQGEDGALWHTGAEDRAYTLSYFRFVPLQLQAGVFFVARNPRTERLFAAWHAEWRRFKGQDQGAFLRALYRYPVKVWAMGRPWNGGAVIGHRFGAIRV